MQNAEVEPGRRCGSHLTSALCLLISGVGLYLRYVRISFKGQLQYRASFVMKTLGHLLITGLEFFGVWALFHRFGHLNGWRLPEVAMFYGIVGVAFSIADAGARGFDVLPDLIRRGDLDRLLLRPRSIALQLAAQELTLRRLGRFTQSLIVLVWGAAAVHLHWSAAKLGLLVAAIVGGACMFYGLVVLQATIAFWTIESLEIMNTLTYGGVETAQYPLSIYRTWFRRFFTLVVPLACVNYYPALAILGRPDPFGAPRIVGWLAPLVGVGFLLICLQVWRLGVRHYKSTGS